MGFLNAKTLKQSAHYVAAYSFQMFSLNVFFLNLLSTPLSTANLHQDSSRISPNILFPKSKYSFDCLCFFLYVIKKPYRHTNYSFLRNILETLQNDDLIHHLQRFMFFLISSMFSNLLVQLQMLWWLWLIESLGFLTFSMLLEVEHAMYLRCLTVYKLVYSI